MEVSTTKEKFIENRFEYELCGDYYLPSLTLEESKFKNYHLSKYRRMRLNYLKNYVEEIILKEYIYSRFDS